jgi:hypothetical protein
LENRVIKSRRNSAAFEKIIQDGYITPAKFRANLAEGKGCNCLPDMKSYACEAGDWCIHKITPDS